MTYKRNAYMRMFFLNRGTYTNFGEPNTHYVCDTNSAITLMNLQIKAATNFKPGDRMWFTIFNGDIAFQSFTFAGSNDIVNVGGGSTNTPYYTPRVKKPLKLMMTSKWIYESGGNT